MDAARDLFVTHGFDAVSLRKIAEAIEYTPAAIYVHFADKEALFRELATEDFKSLARVMPRALAVQDPLERIAMVGRAYVEFGLRHPNHYRLMFMTPQTAACGKTLTPEEKSHKGNPAEDAYAFLHGCCVEAIEKGLVRPAFAADPALLAQTLWAGVHGVTSIQITMGEDPWIDWRPVERRIGAMVWTLVKGVAREPANYGEAAGGSAAAGEADPPGRAELRTHEVDHTARLARRSTEVRSEADAGVGAGARGRVGRRRAGSN
ncbi:MAG TPA: TetR/AcrR family transcriptional regulator [Humisphaera sp.]